jgi:hypothetical protein
MSKIEVDTIAPQSGTTVTLGESGDTITIPAGASIVNNGTQTGFSRTGTVDWDTTAKTASFTAVSGNGYFVNTTSGVITVTLPAGSAGDIVSLADYAATWQTNNVTVSPNGTDKIGGINGDVTLSTEGQSVTFVYADSTQGWLNTMDSTSNVRAPATYSADFLVIAGGGGGGYDQGGGGGAGGYRASYNSETSGGGGSSETALIFNPETVYTITVGAGGGGINGTTTPAGEGNDSSISGADITTITSIGGGRGGNYNQPSYSASTGGSGGGGAGGAPGGGFAGAAGTANQGFAGGSATGFASAGTGGGGAGAVGADATGLASPGAGGDGVASTITGSSVTRGGGGGSMSANSPQVASPGGAGGGGAGSTNTGASGNSGTANTGGGGGGIWNSPSPYVSGSGGSGVVILRVPTARYSGTTTGSPTVTTDGTDTIMTFTSSGSYTG